MTCVLSTTQHSLIEDPQRELYSYGLFPPRDYSIKLACIGFSLKNPIAGICWVEANMECPRNKVSMYLV